MTPVIGRSILLGAYLALSAGAVVANADDLFGVGGLDPSFCDQPNGRQTVVYVDDMMMIDGKQDWAPKLAAKLRATLGPGERLTVVRLSPASGQSSEIWTGCWPNFDEAHRAKFAKETDIFTRNPLKALPEQQKYFLNYLDRALATIYLAGKRSPGSVQVDAQHPPEKNIVRALAFDEGRFSGSKTTIRAIVYSDFAENSDLGSVFKPADAPVNFGKKLGTYLRRGVFYDYGMTEDVANGASYLEATRVFWSGALRSMNASVGGLSTDLNMQNVIPVSWRSLDLTMKRDQQEFEGRLSLLADSDGDLVDSWLQIVRFGVVGLNGTFKCHGAGDDESCNLVAKTLGGITTQSAEEDIVLDGSSQKGLSGEIGVKGALTYPLKGSFVQN